MPNPHAGSRNFSDAVAAARQKAVETAVGALGRIALTPEIFSTVGALSGMYEIEAGKLALEKSGNEKVREFARHMIEDHEDIAAKLGSWMGGRNAPHAPPEQLDPAHNMLISDLRRASGDQFDRRYVSQQKDEHENAVAIFHRFGEHGTDPGLRNLAKLALPVLEHHLDMACALASRMDVQ
jgi:putative membrane protein